MTCERDQLTFRQVLFVIGFVLFMAWFMEITNTVEDPDAEVAECMQRGGTPVVRYGYQHRIIGVSCVMPKNAP